MKLFEIFGTVKVDTGPAEAGLANVDNKGKEVGQTFNDLGKKAIDLGSKMGSMGKKLTKFGGNMTKKVTLPIVAAGTASFMFAADLEDAMGASEQIFKGSANEVKKWADNLETYYGIAEGEALTYANTMGTMLKNIGGLTEAEAAKQSQTLVELAGDLTAMFGGTTESAVQALTNALKGNNSMLDNYGMGINDATVKTKAFEMGIYSGKGQMDLAAKQAATLALIMEQTGDAQGQAAREADGASGSLRSLVTELKNLSTEIGEILLPIITPMITKLRDMAERFSELSPGTQKAIISFLGLIAVIGPVILVIGKMMTTVSSLITVFTTVSGAISSAGGVIALLTNPIGIAIAAIGAIIGIGVALVKNWNKIKEFGGKLKDGLVNTWGKLTESTKEAFGKVKDFGSDMVAGLKSRWDSLSSNTKETFKTIAKNMFSPITGVYDAIKKVVEKIKKLFKFEIKFPKIKAPKWLSKLVPSLGDKNDGPENNDGDGSAGGTRASKKFFAKGGYMSKATEFARINGVSHIGGEAGGEGIVPLEGKHMVPFAETIAKLLNDKGGGGTQVNNEFNIASLVVREEADIRRIAEELEALTMRKNRLRGGLLI